jgi:hypothetical protein
MTSEDEHDRELRPLIAARHLSALRLDCCRRETLTVSQERDLLKLACRQLAQPLQTAQAMNDATISIPLLLHTVIRRNTQSALCRVKEYRRFQIDMY